MSAAGHGHALSVGGRVLASCSAAALLSVLALAAWLEPSPNGFGTHRGLGMAPCGWMAAFGRPCPTCGMTTAFAHAANADFIASFRAQPMGAVMAIAASAAAWLCAYAATTGSAVLTLCGQLLRPRVLWWVVAGLAGAWIYKLAVVAAM